MFAIATYFKDGVLVEGWDAKNENPIPGMIEEWRYGFGKFYEGMKRGGTISMDDTGLVYLVPISTRQWHICLQARKVGEEWKFLADQFRRPRIFIKKNAEPEETP